MTRDKRNETRIVNTNRRDKNNKREQETYKKAIKHKLYKQ